MSRIFCICMVFLNLLSGITPSLIAPHMLIEKVAVLKVVGKETIFREALLDSHLVLDKSVKVFTRV